MSSSLPTTVNQVTWHFIIFVILLITMGTIYFAPQKVSFDCVNFPASFNSSEDPKTISVISDIHINEFIEKHSIFFQKALNDSSDLGVDLFLNGGDLADNLGSSSDYATGFQYEPDGILYQKLYKESKPYQGPALTLDVEGNHDEFGLSSYDSPHHYDLNYTIYFHQFHKPQNQSEFNVFTANIADLTLLSVNPYYYPTGRCRLGLFLTPTRNLLNLVEAEIESLHNQSKHIDVILTHYPVDYWDRGSSSKGNSFRDLIAKSNASIVITGHVHRSNLSHFHHDGVHELQMPALKDHGRYSIVTIDNDNYVSHFIETDKIPKGLITSPSPINSYSKFTPFARKAFEIRVLLFTETSTDQKVTAKISDEKGKVVFDNLVLQHVRELPKKDNAKFQSNLYSVPVNFSEIYPNTEISQKFKLEISSDSGYQETITFYIGNSVNLPKEIKFKAPQLTITMWFFVCLYFLIYLFITQPFFTPYIDTVEDSKQGGKGLIYWIKSVFLGFVYVHYFFTKCLRKWFQYTMFLVTIFSIIIPHALLSVDGKLSMIWSFGLVSNGKTRYDFTTAGSALIYAIVVLYPPIIIAIIRAKGHSFIFSLSYCFFLYFVDVAWIILGMLVATGPFGGLFSIGFMICPLILNILAVSKKAIEGEQSRVKPTYTEELIADV